MMQSNPSTKTDQHHLVRAPRTKDEARTKDQGRTKHQELRTKDATNGAGQLNTREIGISPTRRRKRARESVRLRGGVGDASWRHP